MSRIKSYIRSVFLVVPALVILIILGLSAFNKAFSGPSDESLTVLMETDFTQDHALFAVADENIVAVFLESPSAEVENSDTGGIGYDVIPYRYRKSMKQTFCWQDADQGAGHYMSLTDAENKEVLKVSANGDCVTQVIEPGDYEMRLYHDGQTDKRVAVFIVTEENKSTLSTTTEEALSNVDTFLDTNRCAGCDLSGVNLFRADLSGVDLSDAILNDAILTEANLSDADLSGAELRNADLSQADLTGADLSGADLTGAILISADMTDANLLEANLENADTKGAILSETQLTGTFAASTKTASDEENQTRVHEDMVATVTCPDGMNDKLPAGNGEDLEVTGPCIVDGSVTDGLYHYRNVNIYGNGSDDGSLTFDDAVIHFWAYNILVEDKGKLIAGSAAAPIGTAGGKLTIHLYGEDQGDGGSGVVCKSSTHCGIPDAVWNTNGASKVCLPPDEGGDPTTCQPYDYFYQYHHLPDDSGEENAYFGYKTLAVSYGGTLNLFGKKGATLPDNLDSSNSGMSWARLDGTVDVGATQLKIDRAVDWEVGDRIVVTTTDYLPGHSEVLEIVPPVVDATTFNFKVVDQFTGADLPGGLKYRHNGVPFSLSRISADMGIDIKVKGQAAAETRAAVALLSRSIRIVSAGDEYNAGNPTCEYDCFPSAPYHFGGHTSFRQGFKEVHVQGVEFYQLGQGGRIGHYPVHFHMARKTPADTFVKDSSIWDSMTRFITVHATHDVMLARNVGFMSIGHGFYLEDGTEINNKFYSNIGILVRAAVKNAQNPRQVPGILAWDGRQAPFVPYNSDIFNPTVFWIMNGWNDFEYNMAAGATGCGVCYWLIPGANSGPSQGMKWESYASMQSGPIMMDGGDTFMVNMDRAGMTPLKTFKGNYCTSAMMSFNTVGATDSCLGVNFFGISPNPNAPVPAELPVAEGGKATPTDTFAAQNKETFYPKVTAGGGRFATKCDGTDCGPTAVPNRCSNADRSRCIVTVLDKYTSSFHWPQQNFGAIWLRPQWYLVVNSFLSDTQNGGLGFVTGGDYLLASVIPGLWQLATKSVFVGHTQKDNPYASNAGPFNPLMSSDGKIHGLVCDTGDANHCRSANEGISMPIDNFAVNQRLFNIYDGPNYQDSNAYLDITETPLGPLCQPGDCTQFGPGVGMPAWMYTRSIGIPVKKATAGNTCVLPNAAIGWKQPNGFFYPPAFHSAGLFFNNVDIRHYVLEPLWKPGTYETDEDQVREDYCRFPADNMFGNFSSVDRQTVLNDDDGSLTGLLSPTNGPAMGETISVNLDPFFNAPVEAIECESFNTAKTSPYEYLSTVVYPQCATSGVNPCAGTCSNDPGRMCTWDGECDLGGGNVGTCSAIWGRPCTNADCYGIPLERQQLTSEDSEDLSTTGIRMAGMDLFQRSMMTLNDNIYYIDTTVSELEQRKSAKSLNVFKAGETYYVFFLYATPGTKQTYQIYVGDGLNLGDAMNSGDVSIVRANIASFPIQFTAGPTDWGSINWEKSYQNGILTVKVDLNSFEGEFAETKKDFCQPETFCTWTGDAMTGSCGCSSGLTGDEKTACESGNICAKYAGKDLDCPKGGCIGFSFKLPTSPKFTPDNMGHILQSNGGHRPQPLCFDTTLPWAVEFTRATDVAGSCSTTPIDEPKFCGALGGGPGFPGGPQPTDEPEPPQATPEPPQATPPPSSVVDTDGDGVNDDVDVDADNDGIPNDAETATDGTSSLSSTRLIIPADPDGDGIPNELDLDSDGDGLTDHAEAGGSDDADGDGRADNFTDEDMDGLNDVYEPSQGGTALPLPDTDGDGIPDFLDSVNNVGDGGSDEGGSDNTCAIAGADSGKSGLAGLLVYALIPAAVFFRKRIRRKRRNY